MSDHQVSVDMSIITPSFNMLGYLKSCCASVADQAGPTHEHVVVDGLSTDGTVEWLHTAQHVRSVCEQDRGMYDAINRGLRLAGGSIVSYLSCDEQYLPGALAFVKHYFETHPHVDGLFGDTLITRPDGSLISFRKSYPPIWPFILTSHLYLFPSSMFLRRRVIDAGELFDADLKYVGDTEFVVRLLRHGYRLSHVRRYLSSFAITGTNRGLTPVAAREFEQLRQMTPAWVRRMRGPLNVARLMLKLVSGCYIERAPLEYAVYQSGTHAGRQHFSSVQPSPRWRTA
jgi:glycosyltransferase involved in cell wall biosynthesis